MDALRVVLVANRGEIAVRLINAARKLGIRSIAIHTEPDSASPHVSLADESVLLQGPPSTAYLDIHQILRISKEHGVDAVIPGYGFLSENCDFARRLAENGITFVGPKPETIESLGLKHTARDYAIKANVPVVPGSEGLVIDEHQAVEVASRLGFPVMLKATAGGGGMGLMICRTAQEVRDSFRTVESRGAALFKNSGVFIERYYPKSHHIEVQVFGNGMGKAISIGERECSIQRRHQKVIEECPSPFVETRYPHLRQALTKCAVDFASSIDYASAGTIEFLVDDETGQFFYLEMNTRLQVEHGITELCYGLDLVELMYRQADAEIAGRGGIDETMMTRLQQQCREPKGHAIELRLCAENPARNYAPSPGTLQKVEWFKLPGTRIDTWIKTGLVVSPLYDSLLAKVMHRGSTREEAIREMIGIASKTQVCGPPNNLDLLLAVLRSPEFASGNTMTTFLDEFQFSPTAIDVLSGGSYTTIQDYPGRPTLGKGFGHAGAMDPITFKCANHLVGNVIGTEALEITLVGPDLRFLGDAIVALCGPQIEADLDGSPFPAWQRVVIRAGQRLRIGQITSSAGCRAYLAVHGGFPKVAEWFGSKATCPGVKIGGYQGRELRPGDYLALTNAPSEAIPEQPVAIPQELRPGLSEHWDVMVMGGPYEEGYLHPEDIDMVYTTDWKVSHNAARGGIRLIGPRPRWARQDGGEGGSHPSNVIEWGYPLGGLNWTGDEPVIFPMDCPNFGGFLCSLTVVHADLWKVGQVRPGNTIRFHRVDVGTALAARRRNDAYLERLFSADSLGALHGLLPPTANIEYAEFPKSTDPAAVMVLSSNTERPIVTYRQGGDNYLLVEYGDGSFDLNNKCRATALSRTLREAETGISFQTGLLNTVGCGSSLQIYYDGLRIRQSDLISHLVTIEETLGSIRNMRIPNRTFSLPLTFTHSKLDEAIHRYMINQRPYASYLPDNFGFVAKNNGITKEKLRALFLEAKFVAVGVGFVMALPQCLPADPRHRLQSPKKNPSRTFTPEGAVSWGGSCMAIYNAEGPGGYMLTGMTIPGVDALSSKNGYSADRPWLFEDMDVITFYEVTEEQYERDMATWRSGMYRYRVEDTIFDMAEHNALLEETREEVMRMRATQKGSQDEMRELESRLLNQWLAEKSTTRVSSDDMEELLTDSDILTVEAPVNANVWKVQVKEGDKLFIGQTVVILEAMKMEIKVLLDERFDGCVVERLLVEPGGSVDSGKGIILLRKPTPTKAWNIMFRQ